MEKMTVYELADKLADNYMDTDFCVDDGTDPEGWYGIKCVSTGFDSYESLIVADYYGGGCMVMDKIDSEMNRTAILAVMLRLIIGTLEYCECHVNGETVLVIDH